MKRFLRRLWEFVDLPVVQIQFPELFHAAGSFCLHSSCGVFKRSHIFLPTWSNFRKTSQRKNNIGHTQIKKSCQFINKIEAGSLSLLSKISVIDHLWKRALYHIHQIVIYLSISEFLMVVSPLPMQWTTDPAELVLLLLILPPRSLYITSRDDCIAPVLWTHMWSWWCVGVAGYRVCCRVSGGNIAKRWKIAGKEAFQIIWILMALFWQIIRF